MSKLKLLFKAPVLTASGYGVHSRQLLRALLKSDLFDVSVESLKWGETPFINEKNDLIEKARLLAAKRDAERAANTRYDISVQVTIPNEFARIADVNIGVTAGIECDLVSPEWLLKVNECVDLLVVPSTHSANVFVNSKFQGSDGSVLELRKPLAVVHEGADTALFNTDQSDMFPLSDAPEFNFLFVGLGLDRAPGEDRKNVSLLIKWFCERFKDNKDVGLILKLAIVNGSLMDLELTKERIRDIKKAAGCDEYPKIKLIHGRLSDAELASLYKHPKVKAFVSLTHGEGFGLPLLEAAACGLPVVTTAWSGHLDFLTNENKTLFVPIDFKLGPIPKSAVWPGVMEEGSNWAYPDENDVKNKLFKVVHSYDKPKEWANKLAQIVSHKFSLETTGNSFVQLLKDFVGKKSVGGAVNNKESVFAALREKVLNEAENSRTLLYTMPMSAGDVVISTGVVSSLKKKFPDHKIFFATQQKYMELLEGNPDIHRVIEFQPWMTDIGDCEKVFDEVYTPNLAVQMKFSNWVHRGKGRLLGDEMANQCLVEFGEYRIPTKEYRGLSEKFVLVHPGSGKGQWEARNYLHWQEVITNLANLLPGYQVYQLHMDGDPEYKDCKKLSNTSYAEMAYIISKAECLVGIDTVSMHMAAALGTKHVALFGSSYSTSTGPTKSKALNVLMDTPSRYSCDKACYRYECSVDKDHPCINEINPEDVVRSVIKFVLGDFPHIEGQVMDSYKQYAPKISGYTHVFNAETHRFPYVESITSMLGFCDEVVVVDGGSKDRTVEKLEELKKVHGDKLQIHVREWDWDEPAMDGMQKAYARALCSGDFLWQQDADEVVHERDYDKIKKLVKRFPKDVDLLHLPVIELWGNNDTVRTDRHSWKWRLSRNNFRITHGIVKQARVYDEKTGKLFAKKGMSDGCEYIDIMTQEYIQHKGFYSNDLEMIRRTDPEKYGEKMNKLFEELPSVYHYSWADLPRKIKNFKKFWNACWSNLYNDSQPEDRFPDVTSDEQIVEKAQELFSRGGEHGKAKTFKLAHSNPEIMKEWLKNAELMK